MSSDRIDDLDKVFKALGSMTRRKILRLLSQRPRYPYELSKILGLAGRGIQKHLVILHDAGLVESEKEKSKVGPDRVYYKLKVSFGLTTTILPNTFVVRFTQSHQQRALSPPSGFRVPTGNADVKAVKHLIRELEKVNKRVAELDHERIRFAHLRGQIINRIEGIMEHWQWDEESCQRVRSLINPIHSEPLTEEPSTTEDRISSLHEALKLFEEIFQDGARRRSRTSTKTEEDSEVSIEFE